MQQCVVGGAQIQLQPQPGDLQRKGFQPLLYALHQQFRAGKAPVQPTLPNGQLRGIKGRRIAVDADQAVIGRQSWLTVGPQRKLACHARAGRNGQRRGVGLRGLVLEYNALVRTGWQGGHLVQCNQRSHLPRVRGGCEEGLLLHDIGRTDRRTEPPPFGDTAANTSPNTTGQHHSQVSNVCNTPNHCLKFSVRLKWFFTGQLIQQLLLCSRTAAYVFEQRAPRPR